MSVTKAVIPAAGLGTRFLPATKATPKEMLPVVDKPAIQYVVEEAVRAGLRRRAHDHRPQQDRPRGPLRPRLGARGGARGQGRPARGSPGSASRPTSATSTSSARASRWASATPCSCAADHVGDDPFAVLLGDDLIDERDHLLEQMIEVREEHGGSVVALMEVPDGAGPPLRLRRRRARPRVDGTSCASPGWSRSPTPPTRRATSPSSAATSSTPRSSTSSSNTEPGPRRRDPAHRRPAGAGRCSDATGGGVHGVVFRGRRYDTGDRLDYLKAVVQLGLEHRELGADFGKWLDEYVAGNG